MCLDARWARESLGASSLHVIVVYVVERYRHSRSNEEEIASIEDDREEIGHVQKNYVDEPKKSQSGEHILLLILIEKHGA